MSFRGWGAVAKHLRALADTPDEWLNDGQRDSLYVLAERIPENGMVIADEVGMGKTRIAVALTRTVIAAGGRVAILVPPTLGFQWRDELRLGSMSNVPDVVRSLKSFFEAWPKEGNARPWFSESIVLISHGLTNWRLGATSARWRYELLPLLAAYARHEIEGKFPYGFRTMSRDAEAKVKAATESIVAYCSDKAPSEVQRRYRQLGTDTAWQASNKSSSFGQGSQERCLLQLAIGLGLGAFDLLIVDEAHKSRSDDSGLSRLLSNTLLTADKARHLCLTATPVELDAEQWIQVLKRINVADSVLGDVNKTVTSYREAAQHVQRVWRSSEEARAAYIAASRQFEKSLKRYVLRRDKRGDADVIRFRDAIRHDESARAGARPSTVIDPSDYRWQRDIAIDPAALPPAWRRAICAAEALSFVSKGSDDQMAKRLRLTFANGHSIAALIDTGTLCSEDEIRQPGDEEAANGPFSNPEDAADDQSNNPCGKTSHSLQKRESRAKWWRDVVAHVARASGSLYDHPAILAAIAAIDEYTARDEKVLVFGRFTVPMKALVALLNARGMLRALDRGELWPQSAATGDIEAIKAAHRQLGRAGQFSKDAIDAALNRQYARLEARRETLRRSLFDLIQEGLSPTEQDARALATAAHADDGSRAVLVAAIDQLLDDRDTGAGQSAEAVAGAFVSLVTAMREHGEGDDDGDDKIDLSEAEGLWPTIAGRLKEEYVTKRGRLARLMIGETSLPTRRALQMAFNRTKSNPRVLVAQSLVGREGLNLHQACRVVILLHPEWNPGVVEQQIGRVDRVGSHWARALLEATRNGDRPLPQIEIRPVIFEGTYDTHNWRVLLDRWDDLRAQLHGVVVPYRFRLRDKCTEEQLLQIRRLDDGAPDFRPPPRVRGGSTGRNGLAE